MTIILMQVRPFGLAPVSGWDAAIQAKYPLDSVVHVTLVKSRSKKMHRFYWALVDMAGEAIGYDKEVLSDELLTRTGRVDTLEFINGEIHAQPKRISKMKHEAFKSYVDDAVALICRDYLAEMTRSKLLLEVEKMLGITYEAAFSAPPTRKNNGKTADSSEGFSIEGQEPQQGYQS